AEARGMAEPARRPDREFTTREDQPVIGIPTVDGSDEVIRYFNSLEEADNVLAKDHAAIQQALSLAGAWAHLDEEDGSDMLDELDRRRQASRLVPAVVAPTIA